LFFITHKYTGRVHDLQFLTCNLYR
jgi:hypothetical protein